MSETSVSAVTRRPPAGRWELVPAGSTATFTARNLGYKLVRGTVPIERAVVDVDSSGVIVAVHAELNLAGLATGISRRDADLAKPHLLDTTRHPKMLFDAAGSTSKAGGWQVAGTLTARGVTLPLHVDAELTEGKVLDSAATASVSVRVTAGFDRRQLGIKAPRIMVGRRIEVDIAATFELVAV